MTLYFSCGGGGGQAKTIEVKKQNFFLFLTQQGVKLLLQKHETRHASCQMLSGDSHGVWPK